jgi:tripeptide aminopeptidase
MIAAVALADLRKNGWFGLINKRGVRGTSNVGSVHGGKATNVVMEHLHLDGECRSFSTSLRRRIADAYHKAFERAAEKLVSAGGKRGEVRFECTKKYDSFTLSRNNRSVSEMLRVLHGLGLKPTLEYSNGGLDANWLASRKIYAATLGAGSVDAHTADDRVRIDQYLTGCRAALGVATGL